MCERVCVRESVCVCVRERECERERERRVCVRERGREMCVLASYFVKIFCCFFCFFLHSKCKFLDL